MTAFYRYPENTSTPPGPKSDSPLHQLSWLIFTRDVSKPATDVLGPIKATTTCGAGITAAAGTSLTHHLFQDLFRVKQKHRSYPMHLEFPGHDFSHCKVSRLLHPVGSGFVSQNPSPGYVSQHPYA